MNTEHRTPQRSHITTAFFAVSLLFMISACSDDQPTTVQEKETYDIFQLYEMTTDVGAGSTSVAASFRTGGESGEYVTLTAEDAITFNGAPLTLTSDNQAQYRRNLSVALSEGLFRYTDNNGAVRTTSVRASDVREIRMNLVDTIDASVDNTITWQGGASNADEAIRTVVAYSVGSMNSTSITDIQSAGLSSVSIPAGSITAPSGTPVSVRLIRRRILPLPVQTTAGGNIIVGYDAGEKVVIVK